MIWLLLAGCGRDCPSVDEDGDGALAACPGDEATADYLDCDDSDPSVRPGATEQCDGLDNDCDGEADENLSLTYYLDEDGDGYGADPLDTCDPPEGYVRLGGDCDDTSTEIGPHVEEICDGVDQDCDGTADDGAGEQLWYADLDGDGYPGAEDVVQACQAPEGFLAEPEIWDCDDDNAEINPAAEESCDERDNDCDGETDEGVPSIWYVDADGDGLGSSTSITGEDCAPTAGYALNADDCDDSRTDIGEVSTEPLDGDGNVVEAADMAALCPCYPSISGTLRIRNLEDSADLSGLSCIEQTGGLVISDNESLSSLDGLESLQLVEGSVSIQENTLLSDISGLGGLTEIDEALIVEDNPVLPDLSGLASLATVSGGLTLTANTSLTHIGLSALEEIGKVSISSCEGLEEINALTSLTTVARELSIEGCTGLTTLELPALVSVGDELYLYNNAALETVSLPELSEVGGELRLDEDHTTLL